MHLKSIEMVGFKSFADRTLIELQPGVSAIVGPNGCGKSNIVDAMRWCLGEMSAKSLRSKQMLDVVFAGASGRAPLNMAEVTLTFDNSHRLLPIDYSEVQVTRRLFRSGESEYFLNKTQCRLKDVRDLFLDTGIGEGYSILAQGEVDFVISSKPEERRELFEEAAGVSKYKARREEALRKLERVQIDLNRLNDTVALVREQMDSLEAAAKKARLYQKAKEDLKRMEVADALSQIARLDEAIAAGLKQADEIKNRIQESTTALDGAEARQTRIGLEQDELEKKIYEHNLYLLELDKQVHACDQAIKSEQELEQEYARQIERAGEREGSLDRERASLAGKSAQLRSELEGAKERLQALGQAYEGACKSWKDRQEERITLERERDGLSESLLEVAARLSAAANAKASAGSEHLHRQSEITLLKKELDKSLSESERMEQEASAWIQELAARDSEAAVRQEETERLQAEWNGKKQSAEALRAEIQARRLAQAQAEAELHHLSASFEGDTYRKGAHSISKRDFPGFRGVVGLLFRYSEGMARWVERALGERAHYLVFDQLHQAQEALEWLKQNQLGRATCIVLEKLPEARPQDWSALPNASSLLHCVQCEPELENLKQALLGSAFVSGGTLYDSGLVDGGSEPSAGGPEEKTANVFLARQNLEAAIRSGANELEARAGELARLEEALALLEPQIAEKVRAFEKVLVQKSHGEELLERKREERGLCRREQDLIRARIASEEEQSGAVRARIEAAEGEAARWAQAQKEKEEVRAQLSTRVADLLEGEHRAEIAAKENEVRLESFQEEFKKSGEILREWEGRLEKCRQELEQSQADTHQASARVEESRRRQKEGSIKIQGLQKERGEVSAEVEAQLLKKSEFEAGNRAAAAELDDIRRRRAELTEGLHAAEMDLRTQDGERRSILKRLDEAYQLTPEQAAQEVAAAPAEPEAVIRLRRRVESMSNSVNLEAPEQHQALLDRYNFLSGQTQDLAKAQEDLRRAIQQINAATKERFRATFLKVRENFMAIYAVLFAGGQADLVLSNEHDLLETGIDILAQPPGKKLQNIALLSGGEKALTAIALLFAFFMVKSSPICVLDEVDAPWDPANVARFLNLLKEFSQKTQFMVVTHNPRTMEVADVLYGVTMQEFGISKILSARLAKKEAATELSPA